MKFFQLTLLSSFILLSFGKEENTSLLLVQTIFRHGDRAPDHLYPTDPNDPNYWNTGEGQLTQLGKTQLYEVGKFLQSWYKDFMTSDPKEIIVKSASQKRTLNSVESFLASFYPPNEKWKITNDLNWQPIPIKYWKRRQNKYLDHRTKCAQIEKSIDSCTKSDRFKMFYKRYQTAIDHLTNQSGTDLSIPTNCYHLCNTLEVEKIHNLTIPDWAETYREELNFLSTEVFRCYYSEEVAVRLGFGPFLGLVTEHIKKKMNGTDPDTKFVINSSHGVNVAGVLRALNFTDMPRPPFSATLLFELHEMPDTSKAVRLLYLNSTNPAIHIEEPHVLVLEGCSEFCPVEFFMKSYEWLIPVDWDEECKLKPENKHKNSGSQTQTRPIFEKYLFCIIFMFSFCLLFF